MIGTPTGRATLLVALASCIMHPAVALVQAAPTTQANGDGDHAKLSAALDAAQAQLRQTFTNLQFEGFGPSPIKGPIYQALAGGKVIYYAPESEQILFASVYDKNGVNLTALAQEASARTKLGKIDPAKALAIGPAGAPTVIEFTDPDCPYCRASRNSGRPRPPRASR